MRPKEIVLITMILISSISLCLGGTEEENGKPTLDIRLQTDKLAYQKGELIDLIVTIENMQREILYLRLPGMSMETSWNIEKIIICLIIRRLGNKVKEHGSDKDMVPNVLTDEPKASPFVKIDGKFYQVVPLVRLEPKEKLTIPLPDISKFFSFDNSGRYTIRFRPPVASYGSSSVIESQTDKPYGKIEDAPEWVGALESNMVCFDILESK